jgi:hypothetical protein
MITAFSMGVTVEIMAVPKAGSLPSMSRIVQV